MQLHVLQVLSRRLALGTCMQRNELDATMESTCCMAGFPFSRPTGRRALVPHGCRLGLRQDDFSVDERRCCDSWWWSPQLLGEEAKSVALSSWEIELFAAITSGTRYLGIQSELMDLGCNCSVTVATDSQSVIDHSKRRGHSVASKHV